MSEGSASIGQILLSAGRIDEEGVERALAHQQEHGGYFGEALVACGLVSEGEVEWGLASQFDLPYVFPEADSIDHEAAVLVSPEWALTHLSLPIMRTSTSLTVVVEAPLGEEVLEELQALTDLEIEFAMASPSRIRELVREVFARAAASEDAADPAPAALHDVLGEIGRTKAARYGLSVRGSRAWAWWDESGTVRRKRLSVGWSAAIEEALEPGPTEMTRDRPRHDWRASLDLGDVTAPVEVHFLGDESGREYLFVAGRAEPAAEPEGRFAAPADGVLSEVRLLARSGRARFVVTSEPPALGHEILPHLPRLLLDPSWRSIYINAEDQTAASEAFSHRLPTDPDTWATELEALRAFHFDAVTVDLSGREDDWTGSALDVASVAFLLWVDKEDVQPAYEAGIRWKLHIEEDADGSFEWSLEALRT